MMWDEVTWVPAKSIVACVPPMLAKSAFVVLRQCADGAKSCVARAGPLPPDVTVSAARARPKPPMRQWSQK
jgi:hypothetical protein